MKLQHLVTSFIQSFSILLMGRGYRSIFASFCSTNTFVAKQSEKKNISKNVKSSAALVAANFTQYVWLIIPGPSLKNAGLDVKNQLKKNFQCRYTGIRLAPVLKTIFINVSYCILVASLTLMALF